MENESLEIYGLKLHESIGINSYCIIMCVPGGWIYEYYKDQDVYEELQSCVFVPFYPESE